MKSKTKKKSLNKVGSNHNVPHDLKDRHDEPNRKKKNKNKENKCLPSEDSRSLLYFKQKKKNPLKNEDYVVRQMSTDETNIKNRKMKNTKNALKPCIS